MEKVKKENNKCVSEVMVQGKIYFLGIRLSSMAMAAYWWSREVLHPRSCTFLGSPHPMTTEYMHPDILVQCTMTLKDHVSSQWGWWSLWWSWNRFSVSPFAQFFFFPHSLHRSRFLGYSLGNFGIVNQKSCK